MYVEGKGGEEGRGKEKKCIRKTRCGGKKEGERKILRRKRRYERRKKERRN